MSDWLTEQITFLGIPFQNWMVVALALILIATLINLGTPLALTDCHVCPNSKTNLPATYARQKAPLAATSGAYWLLRDFGVNAQR